MASSCSEDETDTLPERPTRIQPYQFEPVRQDFERVPEHRVIFEANPMQYSMGFAKLYELKCSLHKWAWCGAARKSARLNCINLIHFRLTTGRLCGSSCIAWQREKGSSRAHVQCIERISPLGPFCPSSHWRRSQDSCYFLHPFRARLLQLSPYGYT